MHELASGRDGSTLLKLQLLPCGHQLFMSIFRILNSGSAISPLSVYNDTHARCHANDIQRSHRCFCHP